MQLVEKYVSQKQGVRLATKTGYDYVIQVLTKDSFGAEMLCLGTLSFLITVATAKSNGFFLIKSSSTAILKAGFTILRIACIVP